MSARPITRRNMLVAVAAGAVAPGALAACGAPSSGTSASAPSTLAATPSNPVTLNVLDVAGNLQLTQGMIQNFVKANPRIISSVTYSKGTAPQLASKIQAQQQGGSVTTGLVLTGTDGLAAGITDNLWTDLSPYYATDFPNLTGDYQPAAAKMATLAQNKGIELVWYPSGPLLEYSPSAVTSPPTTPDALLAWAKANPGKFQYAQPANSGPGRTFLMGLPYLLKDSDPTDPTNGWSNTWSYLAELGKYVSTYPTGTSVTMKNIASGAVDMIASTTGWFINPRALGTVPASMKIGKFDNMTWVCDAQYGVIPKGVSSDTLAATVQLLKWMLRPDQQAIAYDTGYFYPGPAVKNVPLSMAPASSQKVVAQYGDPDFDTWMTQYPIENSLPATAQVTAFDLWGKKIGAAK
jgi:putative spermidine/putrescine transport system substrate-binding protein